MSSTCVQTTFGVQREVSKRVFEGMVVLFSDFVPDESVKKLYDTLTYYNKVYP